MRLEDRAFTGRVGTEDERERTNGYGDGFAEGFEIGQSVLTQHVPVLRFRCSACCLENTCNSRANMMLPAAPSYISRVQYM